MNNDNNNYNNNNNSNKDNSNNNNNSNNGISHCVLIYSCPIGCAIFVTIYVTKRIHSQSKRNRYIIMFYLSLKPGPFFTVISSTIIFEFDHFPFFTTFLNHFTCNSFQAKTSHLY